MTQESQLQRNYFKLNKGLHTESNQLGWPEGYTTYERNYELLRDGSRRRRKGLAKEAGGADYFTIARLYGADKVQTHIWRNVAGDPSQDFYVLRCGDYLYFGDAAETVSTTWLEGDNSSVYLPLFFVDGATTEQTTNAPVTFSQGRGRLLVSGQYIYPFYVDYENGQIKATRIIIKIRDFTTLEDGTAIDNEPGTLSEDHYYNLLNRGWTNTYLDSHKSDLSRYPGRNSIWWRGFRRKGDSTVGANSVRPDDYNKEWNSDKLAAEAFGQSSAPVGSLFLDPTNTEGGTTSGSTESTVNISTWTEDVGPGDVDYWDVTITTDAAHGYAVGDTFAIVNNKFSYFARFPSERKKVTDEWVEDDFQTIVDASLDGTWTALAGTTGSTLVFRWRTSHAGRLDGFLEQYDALGQVGVPGSESSTILRRSTGAVHGDSWQAVAWFAGRAWYAGMLNSEFNDYVFFSQVVDGPEKYGKCYQQADPTDENYNALVSTDGGHLIIPGMGGVIGMESLRNSLILFGRDGVWSIEGGQGGFTPESFRVRKLSESGASSIDGVLKVEDTMMYTGSGGIYIIAPNQYTGLLEVQNVIKDTIQTYWTSIQTEQQKHVQAMYDDAQRRVYLLYGATDASYAMSNMLIFDVDAQAWFVYEFESSGDYALLTGGAIPAVDDASTNKKMKFIYTSRQDRVVVADFDQSDFVDFNGNESPTPIMFTGWEGLGDPQSRKQAPIITVFNGRTETGLESDGAGGYNAVNPGSTRMQGWWDFTTDITEDPREAVTGKKTDRQEVYRNPRHWAPITPFDMNGYPVLVTRNKLRGRGRVLQLRFEGKAGHDSHILGYTANYKRSRRK